ncbi:MAG: hypothetical protein JOS17DRAFT_795502 [Linnemannia elongata]|nr:MAG: hypothetical protein JOS17DRAFT_795502 [Linnemannia elongata]
MRDVLVNNSGSQRSIVRELVDGHTRIIRIHSSQPPSSSSSSSSSSIPAFASKYDEIDFLHCRLEREERLNSTNDQAVTAYPLLDWLPCGTLRHKIWKQEPRCNMAACRERREDKVHRIFQCSPKYIAWQTILKHHTSKTVWSDGLLVPEVFGLADMATSPTTVFVRVALRWPHTRMIIALERP